MSDIKWQIFDIGYLPLRRCSLCENQTKFDALGAACYYCARLKQWTLPMFECPFWEAQGDWKQWYSHCSEARARTSF
jgi:hypothetical protein